MIKQLLAVLLTEIIWRTPGSEPAGIARGEVDLIQRLGACDNPLANPDRLRKLAQDLGDRVTPHRSVKRLHQSLHSFLSALLGDERCPLMIPGRGSAFYELQVAFGLLDPIA
jgi:hypothetical protein